MVVVILFSPTIYAQSYQNEPNGFRDLKWGTDLSELNNSLYYVGYSEHTQCQVYVRPSDELKIGNVTLQKIEYYFNKNKLCGVVVEVEGYTNWSNLKTSTLDRFGNPSTTNINDHSLINEEYEWDGNITYTLLMHSNLAKKGSLSLISRESLEENNKKINSPTGF